MRIVVLRALGLGDLLTAVPALRALRRRFPAAQITLAAPAVLADLAMLTGAVDEVVDTAPLRPLAPSLHGADLAVNLHGRGPQSLKLLAASNPHRLVSFGQTSNWREDEHEVSRWCRLLSESGITADAGDLALPAPRIRPLVSDAVVIHPGAADPARRWPAPRWAAVASKLSRRSARVVLTGSADERARCASVAGLAGLPADLVLAGATDLLQLAAVVSAARLVVCGDTGVGHLATAYGVASVLLFGPTSPRLWGPPADRRRHHVLWHGRTGDPHGAEPDPGLLAITVPEVLGAAFGRLHENATAATSADVAAVAW